MKRFWMLLVAIGLASAVGCGSWRQQPQYGVYPAAATTYTPPPVYAAPAPTYAAPPPQAYVQPTYAATPASYVAAPQTGQPCCVPATAPPCACY